MKALCICKGERGGLLTFTYVCACVCQRGYAGYDGFEWVQRLVSGGQRACVCACACR